MQPLPTDRSNDPGAAEQADGDATREAAEIQAPPPTGPPQQPAGTPTRVDTPQLPPPDPLAAASAGPAERGKFRRRLRRLKRVRAQQLVELGTLVVDARRRANGSRPEVLERRAAEAAEVDRQVREIQHAVDAHADSRALATGVAGSCAACGNLLSTEDRFCPSCGAPTKPGRSRPIDEVPAQPSADTGPQQAPHPVPTPARPLPATAPVAAEMPPPLHGTAKPGPTSGTTTESPALSGDTAESPAIAPPPPADDSALAHADPAAIPPPPPPPGR
jgi:hypothetical protein